MSLPAPAAADLPPTALEHLPDDPALLKRMIAELLASLHQHQRDNEALRHRLDLLLRRLYGPRSEPFRPDQPLLFAELAPDADAHALVTAAPEPTAAQPQRRCRPHGRRRLPDHLRREPCHHELTEAQRLCPRCGRLRLDIGVDTSEQLDYRPASLFVIEHFVHKYACPCCRKQAVAEPLAHAAPEGRPLATPAPEPAPVPAPAAFGPAPPHRSRPAPSRPTQANRATAW
jgi:hypothetical protein